MGLSVFRVASVCACFLGVIVAPAIADSPAPSQDPSLAPRTRGRLLKVPKVYNALITSNEPLLPSRTEQATVGQVLYYPPHGYPASSGPLVLPQVAAQAPPLYHPGQQLQPQPLVSLPPPATDAPALEVSLSGQGGAPQHAGSNPGNDEAAPWPVVYASDLQQQQQDGQQRYMVARAAAGHSHASAELALPPADQPETAANFPAARAVQSVEQLATPGQYQPPPAVHIDSIKNNRPTSEGIRDVPPPPLPVGRGRRPPMGPLAIPPGILPF